MKSSSVWCSQLFGGQGHRTESYAYLLRSKFHYNQLSFQERMAWIAATILFVADSNNSLLTYQPFDNIFFLFRLLLSILEKVTWCLEKKWCMSLEIMSVGLILNTFDFLLNISMEHGSNSIWKQSEWHDKMHRVTNVFQMNGNSQHAISAAVKHISKGNRFFFHFNTLSQVNSF